MSIESKKRCGVLCATFLLIVLVGLMICPVTDLLCVKNDISPVFSGEKSVCSGGREEYQGFYYNITGGKGDARVGDGMEISFSMHASLFAMLSAFVGAAFLALLGLIALCCSQRSEQSCEPSSKQSEGDATESRKILRKRCGVLCATFLLIVLVGLMICPVTDLLCVKNDISPVFSGEKSVYYDGGTEAYQGFYYNITDGRRNTIVRKGVEINFKKHVSSYTMLSVFLGVALLALLGASKCIKRPARRCKNSLEN